MTNLNSFLDDVIRVADDIILEADYQNTVLSKEQVLNIRTKTIELKKRVLLVEDNYIIVKGPEEKKEGIDYLMYKEAQEETQAILTTLTIEFIHMLHHLR